MTERWLPVPGYEDSYAVSDQGRVRSIDRTIATVRGMRPLQGRVLAIGGFGRRGEGRPLVILCRRGVMDTRTVQSLVLEAFVGPRPEGLLALHRNDDCRDNRVENLYWGTRTDNQHDRVRNGRDPNARKTHCPAGHPYSGENLRISPTRNGRGNRICRECQLQQRRARRLAAKT